MSCPIEFSNGYNLCDINLFREGVPLGKNMTLNGSQIVSLKVLKAAQPADEAQAVSSSEKKENARKVNGANQNGTSVHRSKSTMECKTWSCLTFLSMLGFDTICLCC